MEKGGEFRDSSLRSGEEAGVSGATETQRCPGPRVSPVLWTQDLGSFLPALRPEVAGASTWLSPGNRACAPAVSDPPWPRNRGRLSGGARKGLPVTQPSHPCPARKALQRDWSVRGHLRPTLPPVSKGAPRTRATLCVCSGGPARVCKRVRCWLRRQSF